MHLMTLTGSNVWLGGGGKKAEGSENIMAALGKPQGDQ